MGLQPRPGDDAERALGAHEELVEVGADRLARLAAGAHDPPVGVECFVRLCEREHVRIDAGAEVLEGNA